MYLGIVTIFSEVKECISTLKWKYDVRIKE